MEAGFAHPLNALFASSFSNYSGYDAARSARDADARVRAQAAQFKAEAGPGSNAQVQYQYTTGPDGKLYASGATVTTSKRTQGQRDATGEINENQNSLYSAFGPQSKPKTLGEISRPQAALSSEAFADLFGSEEFLEAAAQSVDNINRGRLRSIDAGVRSQELQHLNAAGGLGSAPVYDYEVGPDGELYAVAGSVNISSGPAATPEEAARDAATIARAALAATDVSAQDISVARSAQSDAAYLYASNMFLPDNLDAIYDVAA